MNDNKAIHGIKKGNTDALEWLIERYAGYVNTIVYNIIGDTMTIPDIEEVVSDVFLALWDNANKIRENKLKAYLGSIARNKAKNKLRELGTELNIEENMILISDGTPESTILANEKTALVKKAILAMEYPDREIFLRHYYYYQGVSKIAEEMNINVSTVKTHLVRGRQQLKNSFSEGGHLVWKRKSQIC